MRQPEKCICATEDWELDNRHNSDCPCYKWQYRLPNDGTCPDFFYNEVCKERDRLLVDVQNLRTEIKRLQILLL